VTDREAHELSSAGHIPGDRLVELDQSRVSRTARRAPTSDDLASQPILTWIMREFVTGPFRTQTDAHPLTYAELIAHSQGLRPGWSQCSTIAAMPCRRCAEASVRQAGCFMTVASAPLNSSKESGSSTASQPPELLVARVPADRFEPSAGRPPDAQRSPEPP
jgi:hypothetical protein